MTFKLLTVFTRHRFRRIIIIVIWTYIYCSNSRGSQLFSQYKITNFFHCCKSYEGWMREWHLIWKMVLGICIWLNIWQNKANVKWFSEMTNEFTMIRNTPLWYFAISFIHLANEMTVLKSLCSYIYNTITFHLQIYAHSEIKIVLLLFLMNQYKSI